MTVIIVLQGILVLLKLLFGATVFCFTNSRPMVSALFAGTYGYFISAAF